MAEPSAEKYEVWQDVLEKFFLENLELSPEFVKKFFVSNIVQRSLAHVVGQGVRRAIPVGATEAGALKVAPVGGGTAKYETLAKAAITDAFQIKTFAVVVSRVDVTTWDFNVILELSDDGITYGSDIVVNAGVFYSLDQSVKAIKYKNGTPGSNATLQLVGFY